MNTTDKLLQAQTLINDLIASDKIDHEKAYRDSIGRFVSGQIKSLLALAQSCGIKCEDALENHHIGDCGYYSVDEVLMFFEG